MLPGNAIGIGWRNEIAGDLLLAPNVVDFIEVVAEAVSRDAVRREVAAVADRWPVALHGVKLSLGSAGGMDLARAAALGSLARELGACCVKRTRVVRSLGQRRNRPPDDVAVVP